MKESTAKASADRTQRTDTGANAAAFAPPGYSIDFLDSPSQAKSDTIGYGPPAVRWDVQVAVPTKGAVMPWAPAHLPTAVRAEAASRPGTDGATPSAAQAVTQTRASAARTSPTMPPRWPELTAAVPKFPSRPGIGASAQPLTLPTQAGSAQSATERCGTVDFLAAIAAQPEAAKRARAATPHGPTQGKSTPMLPSMHARKQEARTPLPPAHALPPVQPNAGPSGKAPLVAPFRPDAAPVPQAAAAPESAAAPTPMPGQGPEALAEDAPATAEQERAGDKLDAAAPQTGGSETDSSEETAPEPPATPQSAALPVGSDGAELSSAAAVAGDLDRSPTSAGQPAERLEQLERAGEEQAAEQRTADREEQRVEDQPATALVDAAPAAGEGVELSWSEKAAGLASVGEDVGGGEAAAGDAGGAAGGSGAGPVPEPEAPDTVAMAPESGLAAAASLPVGAAAKALGGVGAAVDSSVQGEGERLQGEMPQMEVGGDAGEAAGGPAANAGGPRRMTRAPAAAARPSAPPKPLPEPPPSPVRNIPAPRLAPAADGALSAADAQRVQASIQSLPTTDPGLEVRAGPPPALQLSGDADPAQVADQREQLNASIADQRAYGAADVAAPAGEDDIRVRRPRETLRARPLAVPAGAAGGTMEGTDEAVAIIAEQKKGDEVRAAIGQASADVAARRAEHQAKVAEEQSRTRQQLDELRAENAGQQSDARRQARAEVAKARADWSEEQRQEVAKADDKTQAEIAKGNESIGREQKQADEQAARHIADGEQQAQRHKRDAEAEASAKKRDAENESQGAFSWLASKVSAFFDKLKQGLTAIFDAAKRLVRAAIEQAKKLAVAVIEKARAAVVSIIRVIGDALIAIGDFLLAAFPGLRAKWRAFIEAKVKAAQERVNQLADALKRGAQKLFDLLGKGLEGLLDLYRKGMLLALDAAKAAAKGAIKFAQGVAETLGAFVAIVKDIARNPGQWLSNLGAAIKDGIRNHLWKAFSSAVKTWFNEKIDEVVGIGTLIWSVLKKGGLGLKEIGAMVWEGLKKAIPTALIGLLIEKLVAMIVPAAGAVMVVIEGLKAAWGSIQRIIAAIGKFVEFLKAVKSGGAGPQFSSMVAAAAVVVIDFVSNWLLRKLRGPGAKVGGKIKAIAQKIMAKIKAAAKKVAGWVKGKFKGWKKKFDDWRNKRKDKKGKDKDKQQEKQERLRKAVEAIRPKLQQMVANGKVSGLLVRARLLIWRVQHRLSKLSLEGSGDNVQVIARVNPSENVLAFVRKHGGELRKIIYDVAREIFARPDVKAALERQRNQMEKEKAGSSAEKPLEVNSPAEALALSRILSERRNKGATHVKFGGGGVAVVDRVPMVVTKGPRGGPKTVEVISTDIPPGKQYVRKGGAYVDHGEMFGEAATREGRSVGSMQSLANIAFAGQSSRHHSQGARDFAAQQALLKIVEMSRSGQAVVVSMEQAQMVGLGRITHAEGIRGDPMTHEGATTHSPVLERQTMKHKGPGDVQINPHLKDQKKVQVMNAMIEQQIRFIATVMEARYDAQNIMFRDEHGLLKAVRDDVQKAVRDITEKNLGLPPVENL